MTTSDDGLWIHQESAVISAEFHDVWRFSPEFLLEEEIVHESWVCHRASRSTDQVSIQYGPSHWSMTQNELWISVHPEQALTSDFDVIPEDGGMSQVQVLAHNFLLTIPSLPSRRLWFYWRISAIIPDRNQWMQENFLNRKWPIELGAITLSPNLLVHRDGIQFDIRVRNETYQRGGVDTPSSITFECFVSRTRNLVVNDMLADIQLRPEWWRHLVLVIKQLLGNED